MVFTLTSNIRCRCLPDVLHAAFKPARNVFDWYFLLNNLVNQECFTIIGMNFQAVVIHSQKNCGARKCNAFVPVHKTVVLTKALKKCGRLQREGVVISGLGPYQGAFQQPHVTNANRAAKPLYQLLVQFKYFLQAGKQNHFHHYLANRFSSSA